MTLRVVVFLCLATMLFVSPPAPVAAEEIPRDTAFGNRQLRNFPMAVADFKNFSKSPDKDNFAKTGQQVMLADFEISGYFQALNPKSYLEDVKASGITEATTDFTKWSAVGASGLVKAGFWIDGDNLKIEMKLFNVGLGKEVLAKAYEGKMEQFRDICHRFADEVVKYYTGADGIFSTRLTAVRKVNQIKTLWVCDFDGKRGWTLVDNGSINLLPAWSRDGGGVFFTSYANGNPDLFKVPAAPKAKPVVISQEAGLNVGAATCPDGKSIALTMTRDGNSEIYVMSTDGKNPIRITNSWGIDTSPAWSPTGDRLTFVSNRSGSPQIYVTPAVADAQPTRLTFQGNYNQSPAWSPQGDKIVFTGRDERLIYDLFLVDVETREITRLTQDQGNNEDPGWSPDGNLIIFTSTREGGKYKLWLMNADGTGQRKITDEEGEFTNPDWGPLTKGK